MWSIESRSMRTAITTFTLDQIQSLNGGILQYPFRQCQSIDGVVINFVYRRTESTKSNWLLYVNTRVYVSRKAEAVTYEKINDISLQEREIRREVNIQKKLA